MHYTFIDIPKRCILSIQYGSILQIHYHIQPQEIQLRKGFILCNSCPLYACFHHTLTNKNKSSAAHSSRQNNPFHSSYIPDAKQSPHSYLIPHLLRRLPIHESQSLLPTHSINTTRLVMERNTIALIRHEQHLWSESRADKLSAHTARTSICILGTLLGGDFLEHLCYSCAVLGIEIGVDFIEEVEGSWIALLDCEDKGQGT
jgi:hypothetical protein